MASSVTAASFGAGSTCGVDLPGRYDAGVPTLERLSAEALRTTMITFRDIVHDHAASINRLNVYPVPDGDTGTNMARTLDAVVAELERSDGGLESICTAISHGSLMGARGNSGVILSQILRGMATTLLARSAASASPSSGPETGSADEVASDGAAATLFADALANATAAAYQAVAKPVEGTILTVVREVADGARSAADAGATLAETLRAARRAGRESLARTPDLLPVLKEAGVVDAGGAGFLLLLDAALHVVSGEPLPMAEVVEVTEVVDEESSTGEVSPLGVGSTIGDLRYEVMCFVDLGDEHIDALKRSWGAIGDSVVVVGGDGIWNCHVHTNEIGPAIEAALANGGRPHDIRVTDLFEEVAAEHARRDASMRTTLPPATGSTRARRVSATGMPAVTCAVVAVSSGDGLTDLFVQLGVQAVVSGGQTVNPSTAELLAAVEAVNADEVIVLPNNKNIVPVAEQLDALTNKTVLVVPTRSMPEALASLVVYDPVASAAINAEEMARSAKSVATGEVTRAERDVSTEVGPVAIGDWIGMVDGEGVVVVDATVSGAATALLGRLIDDGREIVTVIEGSSATGATTDELRAWLAAERPDVQVEIHRGGQPHYPYLFGVE